MTRHARLQSKKSEIFAAFADHPTKIFTANDLKGTLAKNRKVWHIPASVGVEAFVDFLSAQGQLKTEAFKSRRYGTRLRFCWGHVSDHELALSLVQGSYISHGSAAFLHGLVKEDPHTISVNKEQTPKSKPTLGLSQSSIDRAFENGPRVSHLVFKFRKRAVQIVSGKSTNNLGICDLRPDDRASIRATGLERTLIDIAVRPEYAGGPLQVLSAYQSAKDRVSPKELAQTLEQLDYVYPYHQTIGFYLTRARYPKSCLQLFRKEGLRIDFYLMHGIAQTDYDPEWRLHIPKGF